MNENVFDAKMNIDKLVVEKNKLNISVTISCPFEMEVSSPKSKIVFEYKGKTRRMPFLISNYFRQKQSNTCVIVCTYTYNIDYIFDNFEDFSELKARIDLYYGDKEILKIPFTVSSNVINDNLWLDIEEKYIEYESVEGVTVFSSPETENPSKEKNIYSFNLDPENGYIIILKGETPPQKKRSFLSSPAFKLVFKIVKCCLGIIFSPILLFIGLLAGINTILSGKAKKKSKKRIIIEKLVSLFSFFLGEDITKTAFGRFVISIIKKHKENLKKHAAAKAQKQYLRYCREDIVPNRITFMSGRRDEIGGNYEFVYNLIKDREDIDFQFLMFSDPSGHNKAKYINRFLELYATSKVVIVDDYFRLLNTVKKREGVTVIQLWHACGAFKSFGFTRLGKKGGPKQISPNHRMYDYAIVSSQEIAKHYAEGFGISDENVVATGVPRTDVFMDKAYAERVRTQFFERHPKLKGKKIVLFAPTFRGNGQMSAHYPKNAFHPQTILEGLGDDYAIIIKLHPFCKERFEIPMNYRNQIIDLSDEDELNDLLFVTDLLITDYSSVIFEASLLDIPMLFYAYDLYLYIKNRDFYYDFESFVPGKIVFSEGELIKSIKANDFEQHKIKGFKNKFFDSLDGKSSQRVADLVLGCLNLNNNAEE